MYGYYIRKDGRLMEFYPESKQRTAAKARFFAHLYIFLTVSVLLAIFYLLTSLAVGTLYFFFPIWLVPAWGALVFVHFVQTFAPKNK